MSDNIIMFSSNNEQVISLWQEAFGDSREDIEYFIHNCRHKSIIGYYIDDELVSMLFFVDCTVLNEEYKYIYAACTKNKYRSHGFMSELLEYTKKLSKRIVLIPADYSLVKYYEDRGFKQNIAVDAVLFNEIDEIKEYLLEGCELDTPFAMCYIGD